MSIFKNNEDIDENVSLKDDIEIIKPKLYKVILHNDDYTSMDFVVMIITEVFAKSASEATKIMYDVHNKGKGIVGVYTYDIALTKIEKVTAIAKEYEFPLKCSAEPE